MTRAPFLLVLLTAILSTGAFVHAENIDPSDDGSQYAWAENVGWINAEPSGNGGPGMQVGDFAVTGWLWGENIGWVSLSCSNTGSCGTASYGVTQDSFGVLSGYGWGENVGWVNFRPAGGGVAIATATGDFSGYAWGENIGWISFNCTNTGSCATAAFKVRTGWTCGAAAPTGVAALSLGKSPGITTLAWGSVASAGRYDVVRGSVGTLRSSEGNFTTATEECLADNQAATSLSYSGSPGVGAGYWFLVRAVNCGGNGTYNSGAPSQVGDRDAEIAASAFSCP
jgi:hypothetical protein